MMKGLVSRRSLLSIVLAGGGALLSLSGARRATGQAAGAGQAGGAGQAAGGASSAPGPVSEKDSLAVALGYVTDAKRLDSQSNPNYQAGSSCGGCAWYQGKVGDAGGPCTFFPGKLVSANGWCKMWAKKT